MAGASGLLGRSAFVARCSATRSPGRKPAPQSALMCIDAVGWPVPPLARAQLSVGWLAGVAGHAPDGAAGAVSAVLLVLLVPVVVVVVVALVLLLLLVGVALGLTAGGKVCVLLVARVTVIVLLDTLPGDVAACETPQPPATPANSSSVAASAPERMCAAGRCVCRCPRLVLLLIEDHLCLSGAATGRSLPCGAIVSV